MSSEAIATVVKMMETLPEAEQEQVVEHLREYIADMEDDLRWDAKFRDTQSQLAKAAQRAREEVANGQAQSLNLDDL